jgi:hypothetical protein
LKFVDLSSKAVRPESSAAIVWRNCFCKRGTDRERQIVTILRINQCSKRAIAQWIATAVLITGDHMESGCQCLEKDDSEALARAGHDEYIRKAEIVG